MLKDDGVIFISIDGNEVAQLMCFVMIWGDSIAQMSHVVNPGGWGWPHGIVGMLDLFVFGFQDGRLNY